MRRQIPESEVQRIFESLGLFTQEERDKFISMKQRAGPQPLEETQVEIQISSRSEPVPTKEVSDAKLE